MPRRRTRRIRSLFKSRAHMQVIVAIADTGSMADAAKVLGTVQPSVSRIVLVMEKEVGCTLFERRRHGSAPTALGAFATARARLILQDMEDADRAFDKLREQLDGNAPKD